MSTANKEGNGKPAYSVVGTRPLRLDGADRVTGRALFGADVRMPGMLYGAILRSPHAHARIVSIDTSQAEALPGVRAVATAADLPKVEDKIQELGEGSINLRYESNNVLARDKVLYHGHAVAAVAATNPHIAAAALALIQVTYEVLPAVIDVRKAMLPDAPILLPELRTDELGEKGDQQTNIASHLQHKRGDPEAGFRAAAVIVEREFETATVHQGYIEPQNSTALMRADGQLTIWTSTQSPFGVRSQVSEILEMPLGAIRVIPMEIGGGFGGKVSSYLDPVAAILSKKSGYKPVKITMSRAEVLAATGPTSSSYIKVKMGADKDGRITAATAYLAYAAGAYPGSPVDSAAGAIFAPYRLDNLQIDGYDIVVNKPRTAAYRAPGSTNAAFASETVIDEICEKLGLDPFEFRLLNGVREGDRRADGPVYPRIGYLETRAGGQGPPALHSAARGPQPRAWRRLGLLVQLRRQVERLGQPQRRRHGQPADRIG